MKSFAAGFADLAKRLPEPWRGEIEETPHLQRHAAARRVDQVYRFRLVSFEDDLQLAPDNGIGNLIMQQPCDTDSLYRRLRRGFGRRHGEAVA